MTALVFAEFVRLPRERALELNAHSEAFERAQQELDTETAERENQWLYEACRRLVRERRADPLEPEEDIVSALLVLDKDDEFVAGSVRQLAHRRARRADGGDRERGAAPRGATRRFSSACAASRL